MRLVFLLLVALLVVVAPANAQLPTECTAGPPIACAVQLTIAPGATVALTVTVTFASGNVRVEKINVTQSTITSNTFDGKTLRFSVAAPEPIQTLTITTP